MSAKPKPTEKDVVNFTIQVPADQDVFLQQAAELLCNSKVGVIKLAISRLKSSSFLTEAKQLATEGAGKLAMQA